MIFYGNNFIDLDNYYTTIKNIKPLSREKERELAIKIRDNNDQEALNELVEANLKYVITIAKRFCWSGLPLYDLIMEGNLSLFRAARKFDPNKGTKFITYARPWITQAIQEFIKNQDIDVETTNIYDYIYDDCRFTEDPNIIFENEIEVIQSRDSAVNELLHSLNKRELRILQLYFGLNGNQEKSLSEIAEELGLTKERVRQIKDLCIEKLQYKVMSDNRNIELKEII